ncbi:hypothetical protein [Streptomyces sp. NPDC057403]|uniref:hypothetical protein n=1 Tax=Streptomyces sp. NPDC057403 TaxID=3346119 RepID=UPI00369CA82A
MAEHWDVIQNVPDSTASGNDMFSTLSSPQVSQPLDHRLTQANQELVTKAFDELMVHKDLTALDRYWGPGYRGEGRPRRLLRLGTSTDGHSEADHRRG